MPSLHPRDWRESARARTGVSSLFLSFPGLLRPRVSGLLLTAHRELPPAKLSDTRLRVRGLSRGQRAEQGSEAQSPIWGPDEERSQGSFISANLLPPFFFFLI